MAGGGAAARRAPGVDPHLLAPKNCYRAYCRLPGARRDTALSAATAAEMAAQIGQAEEAGTARPARRGLGTR